MAGLLDLFLELGLDCDGYLNFQAIARKAIFFLGLDILPFANRGPGQNEVGNSGRMIRPELLASAYFKLIPIDIPNWSQLRLLSLQKNLLHVISSPET